MKTVLVATDKPFAPVALKGIREVVENAGYSLKLLEKYTSPELFYEAVADVDAIIIRSDLVTREVLNAGKNVKIVVRAGAGYDNVDLAAATEKGVVVMNTPGQNSNAVAELALGMMVYGARGFFSGKSGTELKGKKLGIHAFGNVGKYVAAIAKGFGMEVYAFDPFVPKEVIEICGVKSVDTVEDLYKTCQYVSIHMPANEKTKKSIGTALLGLMPVDGVLVNTARKEVINEEELMQIMEQKPKFQYLSDVAPDAVDAFKEKFAGRFYATPKKMGAQTEEANINAGIAAAEQIRDFFEKGERKYQVNK
ncbi:MAG: NAD(P)-dependent oxidoreductase [Bacteroidales bacterium]|nr:NAD(P)-dependent oxidoreductase [Bacteroidales bacterium]